MPNFRLTKRSVDGAASAAKGDVYYWDTDLRGFGLRVTPAGVKSYVFQYRMKGRPARRTTIGGHGSPWTPDLARKEAELRLLQVRQGVDPVELEKRRLAEEDHERAQAQRLAFNAYADQFIELYLKENWKDSWKTGQGTLNAIKPFFVGKSLDQIRRSDIAELLDCYADRPGARKLAHSVLRKLFNWAADRGDLEHSPIAGMKAPKAVPARRRVLSPGELALVWHASQKQGELWGPFVRLLIVTLQRRDEVASLDWSEIDMDAAVWNLPAERAKNDQPHRIPLNTLAITELKALGPRKAGLVFTTTGETGVSGFAKAKRKLDSLMLEVAAEKTQKSAGEAEAQSLAPWRFHDLRRTGATNLQALGIPVEVTEAILNHISGTTGGIAGVYNLYRYDPEKRAALDSWAVRVLEIAGTAADP
jgi:integrase